MIDLHGILTALAQRRPLFHSEADFQHAFAWELHLKYPEATVRLERPVDTSLGLLHLDLVANLGKSMLAVELKYKTRRLETTFGGEGFRLQDHGAQPVSRYGFLKDIARLESVNSLAGAICWAILLTNDSAYWSTPRNADGTSTAFSLGESRTCSGTLDWGASTAVGTKGKSESPIQLAGRYRFEWREYSDAKRADCGRFRYLAVAVTVPGAGRERLRDDGTSVPTAR